MKALIMDEERHLIVKDMPKPQEKDENIIIKVEAASICGTDMRTFLKGNAKIDPPRILGHECAGTIIHAGSLAKEHGYHEGERVTVAPAIGCGQCPACKKGHTNMCDHLTTIGFQYEGVFAPYVEIPEQAIIMENVIKLPDNISYDNASLIEPAACALNGQSYMHIEPGDHVVIYGSGIIGCIHAELAFLKGAAKVMIVEPVEKRGKIAMEKVPGIIWINPFTQNTVEEVMRETDNYGADVVITATSVPSVHTEAQIIAAKMGRISLFGGLPGEGKGYLDSNLIHYKELQVCGVHATTVHFMKEIMNLMEEGKLNLGKYVEMTTNIDNIMNAFAAIRDKNIMQDPEKYRECHEKLYRIYSDIGEYARKNGQVHVCVEAMYSPHHTPWTIEGTKEFLKNIYSLDGNAIYTTVDIGHMTGQHKFRKPEKEAIEKSLFNHPIKGYCPLWLGSDSAYAIWDDAAAGKLDKKQAVINILEEMKKYSYQFSIDERDSDLYVWVEELACYSPIMHIQQTDGITSPHSPFTKENNEKGIVEGKKLLEAIAASYEKEEKGMPPKTDKIVMALELFASNTEHPHEIKNNMRETREYWKQYIPEDGVRLDQLLERL